MYEYQDLVQAVVNTFLRRNKKVLRTLAKEDLYSLAYIGLLKARKTYDPTKGKPFNAFAFIRMYGEILDELRRLGPLSRNECKTRKIVYFPIDDHRDKVDTRSVESLQELHTDEFIDAVLAHFPNKRDKAIARGILTGRGLAAVAKDLGISENMVHKLVASNIRPGFRKFYAAYYQRD